MRRTLSFVYRAASHIVFFALFLPSLFTASPRALMQAQRKAETATHKLAGENRGQQLWKFETGG
jgi:hypothetical protein